MKQALSKLLSADPGAGVLFDGGCNPYGCAAIDASRSIQRILSPNPADRILAAKSLGSLPSSQRDCFIVRLLKDDDSTVREAALAATGYADCVSLWQELVHAVGDIESRRIATALLVAFGSAVVPTIQDYLGGAEKLTRLRFIRILERIGGSRALALLAHDLGQPDEAVRTATVRALNSNHYLADEALVPIIRQQVVVEAEHAAGLLAARADLSKAPSESLPAVGFLDDVIVTQLTRCRQRIVGYLSFLLGERAAQTLRKTTSPDAVGKEAFFAGLSRRALSQTVIRHLFLFLQAATPEQQRQHLQPLFSQSKLGWTERLLSMLEQRPPITDTWLWVCTAYTATRLELTDRRAVAALSSARQDAPRDRLIGEIVNVALAQLHDSRRGSRQATSGSATDSYHNGHNPMLPTIERVILLKGVDLFYETPDAILIELASMLEEVNVAANDTLFQRGADADGMYIIVEGRVKVHDGGRVLNSQGRGEVFGELALLDALPWSASITAMEDTRLLKLDQQGFYLLMEDHIEFARGVIRVLSSYLRGNLRNTTDPDLRLSTRPA